MPSEKFSVIIPCYSCSKTIKELYGQLKSFFTDNGFDFEVVFVNDNSPDNDWEIISELANEDNKVKGVNFSRNFGQHYAITAGLNKASGDLMVIMDGDLEDSPQDILEMYQKHKEGFDIVYAKKSTRGKKSLINAALSKLYYLVYDFLAENTEETHNASFVLLSKKVTEAYNSIGERKRQFAPLLRYLGFKVGVVRLVDHAIEEHTSSYTFRKRFELALTGIIANSTKLLRLCVGMGVSISFLAFLYAIYIIVRKLFGVPAEMGWSSLITSIFFMGGLILTFLGVVALYIETIMQEVKQRPSYVISDTINL